MKKLFLILACTASIISFSQDMSKEETKEWKSKLKSTSPEQFKALYDEQEELQTQISNLNTEVSTFESQIIDLEADNEKLKIELEDMEKAAQATAVAEAQSTSEGAYDQYTQEGASGVVYKVQVGAFKSFDITKYFDKHKNFSGDVDADGTMKYTLGVFNEYWEADKFKKYLRDMGVAGAWVVAYKDGKRVNIKDALEGTI